MSLDSFTYEREKGQKSGDIKPINVSIKPETRSPMYNMAMSIYWSRKPYNVVSQYIKHYASEPNSIVLDPFSGIGVVGIEGLKLRKKCIALDLNPWAIFVTRMLSMPVNLKELKETYRLIEKKTEKKVNALYKIKCSHCKNDAPILRTVYNGDKPTKIRYYCIHCKKQFLKRPTDSDLKEMKRIQGLSFPRTFPTEKLISNSRINVHKNMTIRDLFTKRNAVALSMIFSEIRELPKSKIYDLMRYVFCCCLRPVSKLIHEGGGQTMGFWIPSVGMVEKNVWFEFKKQFDCTYDGKVESQNLIGSYYKEATDFKGLSEDKTILFLNESTTDLRAAIPDNSIGYIMTDPPYADEVPYFELTQLFAPWLDFKMDFKNEIVISDSPDRDKKFSEYQKMMTDAFKEVFRILAPDHYLSVWFHNRDLKVWNMLINILDQVGFEKFSMIFQPHSTITFKQTVSKGGTMRGHFILTYKKPVVPREHLVVGNLDVEDLIVKTSQRVIVENNGATLNDIYSVLIPELAFNHGVLHDVLKIQNDLKPIMERHFDCRGDKWYIRETDYKTLGSYIPLKSRLKLFLPSIMKKYGRATIDEIYQELIPILSNGKTPDQKEISDVLEETCEQVEGGKWRLRPIKRQVTMEQALGGSTPMPPLGDITENKKHDMLIFALSKIGEKAGCSVHIGKKERNLNPDLSRLSLSELPPLGLVDDAALSIIQQIDLLWLKGNTIVAAFEVEESTPVYSGLARFEDLVKAVPNINIKAYIITPETKEGKVIKQFNRAAFKEIAKKRNWKYIIYKDVLQLYEDLRTKSFKLNPETLENIAKEPFV